MNVASPAELELQRKVKELQARVAELERERQVPTEIIQKSPVMISIVRVPDFVYELANPAWQSFVPGKEFVGRRFEEVWDGIADPLLAILKNIVKTGKSFQVEDAAYHIRRTPGAPPELVYVSHTCIPLPGPDGTPERILTLAHETTESVRQRQQLAESNRSLADAKERYVNVLASITEGYFSLDNQWRFDEMNANAERHFQLPEAALLGKDFWQVTGALPGTLLYDKLHEAVSSQQSLSFEAPSQISPDRWAEMHVYPRERCVEVYFHDITERKLAEDALRRSESLFRTLANAIPQLCWMANAEGWIFWYNQRWYEYTGATPEQMTGWGWQSVHDPAVLPDVIERWQVSLATGSPFDMIFPLRGADGIFRPFLTRVMPLTGSNGEVTGWFGTNTDISEQRRTEEALRESGQHLRGLVMAASEVLYRASPDWREMRILRGEEMLADASVPHPDWLEKFIPPADRVLVSTVIAEAIRNHSTFELEHRVIRKDGTIGWAVSRAIPLTDTKGHIVEWFGAATDITPRKQAEQALRESEERFRSLADGCPAIIWVSDAKGRNRFVNRAYREFFGVTSEAAEGYKWQPLVHPDDEPAYAEAARGAVRERTSFRAEARVRRADGEWRWLDAYAEPRFSANGEFIGHAGLGTDITDRKCAEQSLAQAVQRLEAHMDNSPLAVVEFDPQFRVLRWSKEAERIFGWSADEVLGRAIPDMRWVFEEDVESVNRVSREMLDGSHPRRVNVNRNYRKDGSLIECEWYSSAIYDSQGQLTSILSQVLEITQRKRTEERLRQSQKLESVGLLAGGIAHDFNNLLTGIMGNASIVLEDAGPATAERLKEVVASAERAANLTRQLLAYSGKGQFIVRDVDVSRTVQEIASLVEFSIPKSVQLAVAAQRRLPAVRMDPSQLQQILMNLVINAGEAIGEGRPGKITVATSMADLESRFVDALGQEIHPGRYVCIEVIDTGDGIDPEKHSRIFDPFFTTKFTGRGLGLAAVAGIVRSLKGVVTLQSEQGVGTTFRVFLPVAEEHSPQAPAEPVSPTGPLILVVDDEPSVRNFIGLVLRRRGYRVLLASDGREALTVCERESGPIAAAVLDIVMPVMGANDLVPALRDLLPQIKILLTSGYSESEAKRLCAAYPNAAFIQKPYTSQQIAKAIEDLLGVVAP